MPIRQSTAFLTDLFAEVGRGGLVPAAFQRPYVWSRADVEAFWTSLIRGYPVGSVLLWTPPEGTDLSALGRCRIGPVAAQPGRHRALILDGQNRLATYAWSCADLDGADAGGLEGGVAGAAPLSPAERATWLSGERLLADPAERSVRFRDAGADPDRLLVPAGLIARSSGLMPFLRAWERGHGPVPEDQLDWLVDEANRRVLEARVAVTDLDHLSPGEALEAFRHIARAGVPMSESDFEDALAFALPERASAPAP